MPGIEEELEKLKSQDKEESNQAFNMIMLALTIIGIFLLGIFFSVNYAQKNKSPYYLITSTILSMDKISKMVGGRMLVMEKNGFIDSAHYKQGEEIKEELELISGKLIAIKTKLKDKPWAN
ncbi:MAG: hypothetical protein HW401_328 [Parcubacteria group bacterium]|nr:hypothetical protein [Parcubacteria group bacterium]